MTKKGALLLILVSVVVVAVMIWQLRGRSHILGRPYATPAQRKHDVIDRLSGQTSAMSGHAKAKSPLIVNGLSLTKGDQDNLAKITSAFGAPISFYGKVTDQYGEPVPDAKIHYSAADQYFGNSSKYEGTSASDGSFSINGIKGAGLYVSVYKNGYDGTPKSGGGFGYGVPTGNRPPTGDNPAVFILRKKGPTKPLIVVSSRQYEVAKTGEPVRVSLKTGRKIITGQSDIEVRSWVRDGMKDEKGRFEWRCSISVPDGELARRQDDSVFEAPEVGYEATDEIKMTLLDDKWKRDLGRDYFVRLHDNTYALVKIEMMAGGNYNFFLLESYLNPTVGDRNLEFDPAKQVNK